MWYTIGSTCLPYPDWRLPGWNRLSVGLHLDDFRKFYENPDGGRDYETHGLLTKVSSGGAIGFGYDFASSSVFFTYNGATLSKAFSRIYVPRSRYDVYSVIGRTSLKRILGVIGHGGSRDTLGILEVRQVVVETNHPVTRKFSECIIRSRLRGMLDVFPNRFFPCPFGFDQPSQRWRYHNSS